MITWKVINIKLETAHKHKSILVNIVFIICALLVWEMIAKAKLFGDNSEVIFPSIEAIGEAFIKNFAEGYANTSLWTYIFNSMELLLIGLVIGISLAFLLSGLSMISNTFYSIYNLIVSICDLLPGIAVLPVVIIIVGITPGVIVFLVVHAVLWPMSRNILDGFMSVNPIYLEAGKNIGLKGMGLLWGVYIPAATSYIVSGIKVGWARAWRGLLSAEMIFGLASNPGIGLFINQMRTNLDNAEVYATLLVIIIIGLIVQYGILAPIEKNTVVKWGMSKQ